MQADRVAPRLGLNVPYEWWSGTPLLKEIEAAGFGFVQIPSPPSSVLADARHCTRHALAIRENLQTTELTAVIHGPGSLRAGTPGGDRAFEGLLAYAAETGAAQVIYHAACLPDDPSSQDPLLAETNSLARLARRAERLGVAITIENLAPVFPGPELLSWTPMTLRSLAKRIGSPALGLCLDLGHANLVADLRRTDPRELIEPVLDSVLLLHLHDNLGARRGSRDEPGLDPLRLDLHLAPGRGSMPWPALAPALVRHRAPLMLEVHPPHRPAPAALREQTLGVLGETTAAHKVAA